MTFSERLLQVMLEKGFTKYRLSKELKLSATTISNYLKNRTKPDMTKLEVLSDHLGVNRAWLLSGEGEKYRRVGITDENYKSALSVREDDSIMTRYLINIIDKQASMLKVKDDQIGELIEAYKLLSNKMIPLLEKNLDNK